MEVISLWGQPLLQPLVQSKLEWQIDDGARSRMCPIYASACKLPVHLVTTGPIKLHWHGGSNLELSYPEWWTESYRTERREWALRSNPSVTGSPTRFLAEVPLGCEKHSRFPHAGGLAVTFFTGLSLRSEHKVLVTEAMNSYQVGWQIQNGVYDPEFKGEFSLNFQLTQQVPIYIPEGMPLCSLWEVTEQTLHTSKATQKQIAEADQFYNAKAAGFRYHQAVKCPHQP